MSINIANHERSSSDAVSLGLNNGSCEANEDRRDVSWRIGGSEISSTRFTRSLDLMFPPLNATSTCHHKSMTLSTVEARSITDGFYLGLLKKDLLLAN
jgi:hypothetical protein